MCNQITLDFSCSSYQNLLGRFEKKIYIIFFPIAIVCWPQRLYRTTRVTAVTTHSLSIAIQIAIVLNKYGVRQISLDICCTRPSCSCGQRHVESRGTRLNTDCEINIFIRQSVSFFLDRLQRYVDFTSTTFAKRA